jgi:transketolase
MQRLCDLTYKHKLSHFGSCMTTLPILEHIYETKKESDIVVLSAGHAGLALYVILEKYEGHDAEELLEKHGIHPCRDVDHGIHVSTGSLGSGILVAVGYALADRSRDVHVIISDGECAEGSVWEALALAYKINLKNLKIHVNVNGYSAYDRVNVLNLWLRIKVFYWRTRVWFTKSPSISFLNGLRAHYHVMTPGDKDEITTYINAQGVRQSASRGYAERFADILAYGRSWIWNSGQNTK